MMRTSPTAPERRASLGRGESPRASAPQPSGLRTPRSRRGDEADSPGRAPLAPAKVTAEWQRRLTGCGLRLLTSAATAALLLLPAQAAVEVERAAGMGEVVLVRNLDALTLGARAGWTQPKDFARITTSTLASPARALVAGRDPVLLAQQFLREHGGKFCPAPSELRPFQVERDELGMAHVRFEQRIGGLPVLGSGLIVHVGANGVVTSAGGRVAPRVHLPAAGPWALDADQAAQVAEQQAAAEGAAAP